MGPERRDRVRRSYGRNNWKQEDADTYDRQAVQYYKEASVRGLGDQMLLAWTMRKFKRFRAHKIRASRFLQELARESQANLFVHWRLSMIGTFA